MSTQRNPWNWGKPYTDNDGGEPIPDEGPDTVRPTITSPEDGAELTDPLYPILGEGAAPDAEVELWSDSSPLEGGAPNATTTADAEGNFGFTGDTPAAEGTHKWRVSSGGVYSKAVTVTLTVEDEDMPDPNETPDAPAEEEEPMLVLPDRFTTHAQADAWLEEFGADEPEGWADMNLADKRAEAQLLVDAE